MHSALATPSPTSEPPNVAVGVLPSNDASTSPLPKGRRARLTDHVRELVAIVERRRTSGRSLPRLADGKDSATDDSANLLGEACAACRGHCCQTGGDHAYLDSVDVERFWATRPKASAASIVRAYASALPRRTYAGSCVFHGTAGCALPREMRANLCNVFLCDGARALRSRLEESGTPEAFLVTTRDGTLLGATHVRSNGAVRRFRR